VSLRISPELCGEATILGSKVVALISSDVERGHMVSNLCPPGSGRQLNLTHAGGYLCGAGESKG
jgi:ABC-type uncharacterized transport system YnjBCD ATPase subunit